MLKNAWQHFAVTHARGERLRAPITRIVSDIGLFVQLEGGIWGIVHLNDLAWGSKGDPEIQRYSPGDEIETVILSINVELQRVSLGIKQLHQPDASGRPPADPLPTRPTPQAPKPLMGSKTEKQEAFRGLKAQR